MTSWAIRVDGLGKRYRLGTSGVRYDSLRDAIAGTVKAPLRNFRRLRRLHRFDAGDEADVFWALRDISFEVQHGDVIGIIGRNGAGKSTLLKILSRITEPSIGRGLVRGRVGSLLEVGTGFHPDLTGRENIYLNGAILGMDRAYVDRRFDEIVDFSGVAKFIDTRVKRYSSGMYLRLAFAVAAHLESEIMIVDEVLAVGDAQFQKKCIGKMSTVSREGRTVLFVSHNLTAVRTLCRRALLLRQGNLVADVSASEAVDRYMSEVRESVLVREYDRRESAPQNADVVVARIDVLDDSGRVADDLTTATPFTIRVEYSTKHEEAYANLTIVVYDAENNCVFSSLSNRDRTWYGRPMAMGRYRTMCRIPGNLLNSGLYSVHVNLYSAGFRDAHEIREALKLEIQDSAEIRGDYFGAYPGAVRPALQWTTEEVPQESRTASTGSAL